MSGRKFDLGQQRGGGGSNRRRNLIIAGVAAVVLFGGRVEPAQQPAPSVPAPATAGGR